MHEKRECHLCKISDPHILPKTYAMQKKLIALDPRYFQVAFQAIFLGYGIFYLDWNADWKHYALSIGGCLFFNYCFEAVKQKTFLPLAGKKGFSLWGFSVMISALSLCLLLKTNYWYISMLAAFLTVASKYLFRFNKKHIFNPSAFGIIATIYFTGDAWLSPGQWGSNAVIFFFVVTLGTIVVTRVQKLDVSLAFLFTFAGLLYWRQVYVLGWPIDYFVHSVSTGSLLLFTFFMISDPKTSPNHPVARILWAALIAFVSFYLAVFKWKYNTPVWVLVVAAPMVPLLDKLFRAKLFEWKASVIRFPFLFHVQRFFMRPAVKKITVSVVFFAAITPIAVAFCGFYVSKADGTLKNKTSQVILVNDGQRNVITMYNDFQGNFKDFAMVVPVPVVLQKKDIKVVDQQIFNTLNEYSKPRLVEYYDQNPCQQLLNDEVVVTSLGVRRSSKALGYSSSAKENRVKIEAKYLVGEYDILILSAKESTGLRDWLNENGYKIPAGADEVLEPYIKSNLKFFVVKVNEEEKKKLPGNFLRPIQISYKSPKFMLPIRLGMANADGDQDLLIYAFSKKGRIECTNYRTVSLPTGNNIPLFVKNNFGNFYSNLFQHQWNKEGQSVAMLEYAWDVSPQNYVKCDPCIATAPSTQDLVQAGVWWIKHDWNDYSDVDNDDDYDYSDKAYFTRLHVRYNRKSFPQDLMFQSTPNNENFQARYVMTHPAEGDFSCDAGKTYLKQLKARRKTEMENLSSLTGKTYEDWDVVMEEKNIPVEDSYKIAAMDAKKYPGRTGPFLILTLGVIGLATAVGMSQKRKL
jgi:hypothetical protein